MANQCEGQCFLIGRPRDQGTTKHRLCDCQMRTHLLSDWLQAFQTIKTPVVSDGLNEIGPTIRKESSSHWQNNARGSVFPLIVLVVNQRQSTASVIAHNQSESRCVLIGHASGQTTKRRLCDGPMRTPLVFDRREEIRPTISNVMRSHRPANARSSVFSLVVHLAN